MYKEYIALALAVQVIATQFKSNPGLDSARYYERNYPGLSLQAAKQADSLAIYTNINFAIRYGHYISLTQREMIIRDLKKKGKL